MSRSIFDSFFCPAISVHLRTIPVFKRLTESTEAGRFAIENGSKRGHTQKAESFQNHSVDTILNCLLPCCVEKGSRLFLTFPPSTIIFSLAQNIFWCRRVFPPSLLFESSHGYDPGYLLPVSCWNLPIAFTGCEGSSCMSHSARYLCFTSSHNINPFFSATSFIKSGENSNSIST